MTLGRPLNYLFIGILLVFGGFLRFHHLSSESYWMDEGYTVNAVQAIVEKGKSILDSGLPYPCPTYCYPTALLVKHFGDSPSTYRFLAALAGTLFILVTYLVASLIFNKRIALLSALFVTFSYWQIAWSRQARWYTLFLVFFWLAIYCFYKFVYHEESKHKYLYLVLAALLSILSVLTHGLGYILPAFLLLWFGYEKVYKEKNWRLGTLILVCLAIVMVWALPILKGVTFFNLFPYYANFYLREYWLLILLAIPAFINQERRKGAWLLTLLFLAYLIPLSFMTEVLHYRYLFYVTPVFFLLASVGTYEIFRKIDNRYWNVLLGAVVAVVFFASGTGVLIPRDNYFLEADDPETQQGFFGERTYFAYTPQPDWNKGYEFIVENKNESDIVISSHAHFNKIYLGEAGYWIKYPYYYTADPGENIVDDKEYYVGASVIDDLHELQEITRNHTGFIILDYMATDGRIADDILNFIGVNFEPVFHDQRNSYSQVWVYRF